jgi:allantoate deiminase
LRKNFVPIRDDNAARAKVTIERCLKLAEFTEQPGSIKRTFLSGPMRDCHRELSRWLEPLGAKTWVDAAGNFRAVYPAAEADAPRLLIGSHLDTVPDAGAFDGILGVAIGVALLESLRGKRLPFEIELIGFSEEEGVRFGVPFIGSRALAGTLDEDLLGRKDAAGISLRSAIEDFGLKASDIPAARLQGEILGYIEFHIEQGPVLEELELPLAAVDAIVGQHRLEMTFVGQANHAGTTPMHLRRDAIAGAAEWIGAVERRGQNTEGLVATVGALDAKPGATNVIAGEARVSLDVRHRDDTIRAEAMEALLRDAEKIASRRDLTVSHKTLLSQHAMPMDPFLVSEIEEAIEKAGCEGHRMASGAGHDAMILALHVPAAMIFVRTPEGISHSPEESVKVQDVARAIAAGSHLLCLLAVAKSRQQSRPHPAKPQPMQEAPKAAAPQRKRRVRRA